MTQESTQAQGQRRTLLALTLPELEAEFVRLGGRAFHARIARRAVLERGLFDYNDLTSLPAELRSTLNAELPTLAATEIARTKAADGTTKVLLSFPGPGGRADTVEMVHIPPRDAKSGRGPTLCVSTQVGCPVGCPFCASGLNGLVRNLATHEIAEQYVRSRALGEPIRSVVMGIGEPLLNYAALSEALAMAQDDMAFSLGARKITVSTVGFPERVRKVATQEPRFQLAISLHTPDDEQRVVLVPAMKGVPIEEVLSAGDDWFEKTGREVTYEYVLLAGVNDSAGHAARLAKRLSGRRCTVNLIPYNPVAGTGYGRPAREDVERFQSAVSGAGIVCTVRWSRGTESDAACGQLRIRAGAT